MNKEFDEKIKKLIDEKKFDLIPQLIEKRVEIFWSEEYPKMSVNSKISYWVTNFRQQMRWDGESGGEELDAFSKSTYKFCKNKEPDFDIFLPAILAELRVNTEDVYNAFKK